MKYCCDIMEMQGDRQENFNNLLSIPLPLVIRLEEGRYMMKDGHDMMPVNYCPFCGSALSKAAKQRRSDEEYAREER